MELNEVKLFLEQNKDNDAVKTFVNGLNPLNIDRVTDYLSNNEDGKKYLQSLTDAKVTKGIETYKEKTLPKLIAEEKEKLIAELNPKETEDQKKLRLLIESQEKLQKDLLKKDLMNLATKKAVEKNLPLNLIDRFVGDDEESTLKNIDLLATEYNKAIKTEVETKFKEGGRKPHQTTENDGSYYTLEQIKGMSQSEVMANLDKVNQSLSR